MNCVTDYTERVDGFQIRDPVYIGYRSTTIPPTFDIVKWEDHEPYKVLNLKTNQMEISTESCYSVAFLRWDANEECFNFESVGMRWLESNPTPAVIDTIMSFAEKKAETLREENDRIKSKLSWVHMADRDNGYACPVCDIYVPSRYKYCPGCGRRIFTSNRAPIKNFTIPSVWVADEL